MISAKVILDSVSPRGHRPTTFELRYPKFIHGEFMTHRLISRNASSSRAIPTAKLLEEVRSDALRAGPVSWGKNQPGMQAAEELTGVALQCVHSGWAAAAHEAADNAEYMLKHGCHKQIVNRLLEPFSHINVVATATEWMNFFGLRLHADAQPEMRALAVAMWEAYVDSVPTPLEPGDWHLPYVLDDDRRDYNRGTLTQISVARCARVSYRSFETGKPSTVAEDIALYARLMGAQPLHASPSEHQCTPDLFDDVSASRVRSETGTSALGRWAGWANPDEHGNFVGWRQYRKTLVGEACAPLPDGYHLGN